MTTPATPPTSHPALPLNGQVIGQAERSTRAVLERLLAENGTPFLQWVTLNLIGTQPAQSTASLAERLTTGLLIDDAAAQTAIDDVRANGLVDGVDPIVLTVDGRARFEAITAGVASITARLYGDLDQDDLAVARRVLETLTERARAALAA